MYEEVLESERKACGLTQAHLASKIGLTERAYRGYVNGERPMPASFQSFVARVLKSPRLAAEALAEFEDNPFAPVVLDNIDDRPATEICVAVKELREALEAVERLDPTRPDLRVVEHAVQQVMDFSNVTAHHALTAWARRWGIDLWAARQRHIGKLQARGYLKREEAAA